MAQIKVYRKNDKVLIELTNGTTFLGGADGQFVAENGTGSDQVNIKHAEGGGNFIIKDVRRGDIHDGITDTDIGSDRDTCVSLLNSSYFNRNAPINFEIFVKNAGPVASKGDLLELVSHDGYEKPICQKTTNTNNNAVFMAMEDIASQGTGKATPLGTVTGLDTSGETIGDVIYVSDTGTFTTTKPSVRQQAVGYITKVGASDGEVFVNIGSRNSTDVTLAGAYNYLTLAGQEITLGQVDYTTDVSNTPTIPTSGVDFDPVGTDNSTDVTLAGAYNYLTLAGQQITLGQVDYTTDISNTPSIPVSGVDFDPVGTDNSTDVTLSGAYNYLTLAGQQITLGQVDYTTDISNTPAIPTSGVDFDPAGTDNSTDVSINANAQDVLSIASGQVLGSQDAGADKLVFWDDSAGKLTYADIGTNLTMTGSTLSASGGGGGGGGGGSAGGNFMITGFTSSTTQQWYGLYLPYANSIRTSGNWQHYQIYHMPADGSFDNFSMHVQGNCQIEFGINVNPQTAPNDQADGTQYNYKQLSPTGSNHTSYYSPTNWTFSAGDEIGFGFRNVSGGVPFYVTFNVCFTFN